MTKIIKIFFIIISFFLLTGCQDGKKQIEYFKKEISIDKGKNFGKLMEKYKNIDPSYIVFDDPQYYYLTAKLYYINIGNDKWTSYLLRQGIETDNIFQNESMDLLIRCFIEKSDFEDLKILLINHKNLINPALKNILAVFTENGSIDELEFLPPEKELFPLYFHIIKNNPLFFKNEKNIIKLKDYLLNTGFDLEYFKKYENQIEELVDLSEKKTLLTSYLSFIKQDITSFQSELPDVFSNTDSKEDLSFVKQIAINLNALKIFYQQITPYKTKNKFFKYYYLTEKLKFENTVQTRKEFTSLTSDFPDNDIYNYNIRSKMLFFNYIFNTKWLSEAVTFINDYPKSQQTRGLLSLIFRSAIYQKKKDVLIPFLKSINFDGLEQSDQSIYYYLCNLVDIKRSDFYEALIKERFPLSYSNLTINKGKIAYGLDDESANILSDESLTTAKKIDYLLDFDLSDDARKTDYSSVSNSDKKIINEKFRIYFENSESYYEAINYATKTAYLYYGINLIGVDTPTLNKLFPFYYNELVEKYSAEYSVEKALCYAVIREESYFNKNARSWANATGLMQIIPSTGDFISGKIGLKEYDLKNPEDNIRMGTYYLGTLIKYFDSYQLAIAAYNGGQKRINQYKVAYRNFSGELLYELIPNDETRHYIRKVMRSYYIYKFLLTSEKT